MKLLLILTGVVTCMGISFIKFRYNLTKEIKKLRLELKKEQQKNSVILKNRDVFKTLNDKLLQSLSVEKDTRFFVEQLLNEKIKKLELSLDFKDEEVETLKSELTDAKEDSSWETNNIPCNNIYQFTFNEDELEQYLTKNSSLSNEYIEEETENVNEIDSGCETIEEDESKIHENAVELVLQQIISNSCAESVLQDLENYNFKYLFNFNVKLNKLNVIVEALFKYFNLKNILDSEKKILQVFEKYNSAISKYVLSEKDQLQYLRLIEKLSITHDTHHRHHLKILKVQYRLELIEFNSLSLWFNQKSNDADSIQIRMLCKPFVDWLTSQFEKDTDDEEEGDSFDEYDVSDNIRSKILKSVTFQC
ncbi:hypothetical protein HK099_004177 [Clydaea vesicula]|uniref:W2 domain-containing protein n=1 Tax=Clydaea vesicula TaxID=447962 RepID=A0AAD5Y1C3_9FUNG|nr:hypothetical protein HK099_004177 [Clydaea vesicula]KAJ3397251.1 hypothetical protein HDU92_000131 [Lobulomyces angularis]